MRHWLALFPVDRADVDRHAATFNARIATREEAPRAFVVATCVVAILFTIAGGVIAIGGAQ